MSDAHVTATHVWERWAVLEDDTPISFFKTKDDAEREAALESLRSFTRHGPSHPLFSIALVTMSANLRIAEAGASGKTQS